MSSPLPPYPLTLPVLTTGANKMVAWDPVISQPMSCQWDGVFAIWDSGASVWDSGRTNWGDARTYWIE